jgi:ribonuclease VapC
MIVDTSAIFAILLSEPERIDFLKLLANQSKSINISAATLVEAHIVAQRNGDAGMELDLSDLLEEYDFQTIPVDVQTAYAAINAHRTFGRGSGHPAKLNFGDCFAYALAKERSEPLLFKGNDFAQTDIKPAL